MKDDVLISKNRAIRDLKELQTVLAAEGDPFLAGAMNRPIGCLEGQPEVEAVEVVHGRWVDAGLNILFVCSVCGYVVEPMETNYCPDCGAKMDLKG